MQRNIDVLRAFEVGGKLASVTRWRLSLGLAPLIKVVSSDSQLCAALWLSLNFKKVPTQSENLVGAKLWGSGKSIG